MTKNLHLVCETCGPSEAECDGGLYYFLCCGNQAYGIVHTEVDYDGYIFTQENVGALVKRRVVPAVKTEQLSQSQPLSLFWQTLETQENNAEAGNGSCPSKPADSRNLQTQENNAEAGPADSRNLQTQENYAEKSDIISIHTSSQSTQTRAWNMKSS